MGWPELYSPVRQEDLDRMVPSWSSLTLFIVQPGDAAPPRADLIGWDKETKHHRMFVPVRDSGCWPLLLSLPPGQTKAKSKSPSADCPAWGCILSYWLNKTLNHRWQHHRDSDYADVATSASTDMITEQITDSSVSLLVPVLLLISSLSCSCNKVCDDVVLLIIQESNFKLVALIFFNCVL